MGAGIPEGTRWGEANRGPARPQSKSTPVSVGLRFSSALRSQALCPTKRCLEAGILIPGTASILDLEIPPGLGFLFPSLSHLY